MEQEQSYSMKKILDLTLEIIYLLTGEDYKIAKKTSVEGSSFNNYPHGTSPSSVRPPYSPKPEVKHKQKILEVLKKMMELLTGEVPIRCQDVSVYFSMEEWEYLEGHRDLYKDVVMEDHLTIRSPDSPQDAPVEFPGGHRDLYKDVVMENEPPLTSPDGSRKRNPPERCPRPLYSRDSTQEDLTIPHHDQGEEQKDIKVEVKEEEEETLMNGSQPPHMSPDGSRKRNPPERCPRPLASTQEDHNYAHNDQGEDLLNIKIEVKAEEEETYVTGDQCMENGEMMAPVKEEESLNVKMENEPPLTSPDGSRKRNPPERCPRPLYSRDSTQEDLTIPHHDQQEELVVKIEVKEEEEEETHVREDHQPTEEVVGMVTEEESSLSINPGTSGTRNTSEGHLILSPCYNGFTQYSPGLILITPIIQHRPSHVVITTKPSNPKESSSRQGGAQTIESSLTCSVCGKSFTEFKDLCRHKKNHTSERPFPCTECGKRFTEKRFVLRHQKSHTGERPFPCLECGKSFSLKENLLRHQRSHTGERPYSCSECGRGFSSKDNLVRHQRIHTGERPFSCLECGSSFTARGDLRNHERTHTGERPYSCSVCGKSFILRGTLVRHQKTHIG